MISVSDATLNQGVEKKWLSKKKVEQLRDPFSMNDIIPTTALTLNEEQQNALNHIVASSDAQQYQPFCWKVLQVLVRQKYTYKQRSMFLIKKKRYYF